MFTEDLDILEIESDAIKNFHVDLPKDTAIAIKKAAKMAANNLFEDLDIEDIIVVGTNKKETKIDLPEFVGGVGLTTGLDFSKLAEENPEWDGIPIYLATDDDLLAYSFFIKGDQNEETRNFRKNKKELEEFEDDEDDCK